MGATVSSSVLQDNQRITGRAVPSFFRYLRRIILTILVVGGSYFVVREGLRFYAREWHNFKASLIDAELDGQVIQIDEKGILNVKELSRQQLEKHLYSCVDGRLRTEMKLAAVQDLVSK